MRFYLLCKNRNRRWLVHGSSIPLTALRIASRRARSLEVRGSTREAVEFTTFKGAKLAKLGLHTIRGRAAAHPLAHFFVAVVEVEAVEVEAALCLAIGLATLEGVELQ